MASKAPSSALCWIDLEMTGLRPEQDVIIELAIYLTTMDLEPLGPAQEWVIHYDSLPVMEEWVHNLHTQSGLLNRVAESTVTCAAVEQLALDYIRTHAAHIETLYLAGNTIYQDRRFLIAYMPQLNARFHYRLVDVSSLKVLIKSWYPDNPHADFAKSRAHRARQDILESCAELAHYRKHFFIPLGT
jgi:oligoribonuclease